MSVRRVNRGRPRHHRLSGRSSARHVSLWSCESVIPRRQKMEKKKRRGKELRKEFKKIFINLRKGHRRGAHDAPCGANSRDWARWLIAVIRALQLLGRCRHVLRNHCPARKKLSIVKIAVREIDSRRKVLKSRLGARHGRHVPEPQQIGRWGSARAASRAAGSGGEIREAQPRSLVLLPPTSVFPFSISR